VSGFYIDDHDLCLSDVHSPVCISLAVTDVNVQEVSGVSENKSNSSADTCTHSHELVSTRWCTELSSDV
jgi:hypothetical protein